MKIIKFEKFNSLNESMSYYCGTCGEIANHEEIENNPNIECSNCGDCNWIDENEYESMNESLDNSENDIIRKINNLDIPDDVKDEINDLIAELLAEDDLEQRMDICDEILTTLEFEGVDLSDLEDDIKDITLW